MQVCEKHIHTIINNGNGWVCYWCYLEAEEKANG